MSKWIKIENSIINLDNVCAFERDEHDGFCSLDISFIGSGDSDCYFEDENGKLFDTMCRAVFGDE